MAHAISLDALRVLDAIDQKGSFSAAAEALHRVPSALSYTMQKLESDLGSQLFDRRGQRARLTEAGLLVLNQGRELLLAAARLEEAVQQLESGWEPSLTLALDTVIPEEPLLALIGEFVALGKQVKINLIQESLGGGWDALYAGRADLAIGVSGELPRGHYHLQALGDLEFVFALAPSHPLALLPEPIDIEALAAWPAVVVADSSQSLAQRSSGLFDSRQLIRVASMATKIKAQRMGLGTGFLPRHLIRHELAHGDLVDRRVELPRPAQTLYLAWRKGEVGKALNWFVERLPNLDWGL
ncbi:LysR family transcriptional regulator [Shewanella cyperi]|uniref:LysR family transcriptional regulator n=1 Tax=Shewanella cyperi TaxID=2814292 RepID=UPI001A953F92|nr:LysR family transcriptional regulator [Shewanella cyperi]QSX39753.1 LysR family transcriptional regulator [Shewanella cyperi]